MAENRKSPIKIRLLNFLPEGSNYFTLSDIIVEDAESVAIIEVSVDIMVVSSVVVVSSVLGLLWQAAKVNMLPTNNKAITFFIVFLCLF